MSTPSNLRRAQREVAPMYETFEHTADLGLRIRAADLPSLFADAGRGLFSIIVADLDQHRAAPEWRLRTGRAAPATICCSTG